MKRHLLVKKAIVGSAFGIEILNFDWLTYLQQQTGTDIWSEELGITVYDSFYYFSCGPSTVSGVGDHDRVT